MTTSIEEHGPEIAGDERALFRFDNTYARLPERFYVRLAPTPVARPALFHLNAGLAEELGIDARLLASAADVLAGNRVPAGAEPLAQAYAGHQFGGFVPQLGDGRALLLGEVVDRTGQRRDIQLKGSGRTPFSRSGDGRAALGPMLREVIIGEALHAHGIPTTRALAVATTGEAVLREQPLPGAVLTRVAASHIRVGTFQYFAARGDGEAVRMLADHAIARHYPECRDAANPYFAFLEQVISRQADLVARWLMIGFIHGVMNTDNMAISGETIDFGPCAFMDAYHPATVFSSIDQMGRYAFMSQPRIALWNLTRLAECLLALFDSEQAKAIEAAQAALEGFGPRFDAAYLAGLRRKAGLTEPHEGDDALMRDLLGLMTEAEADHTLTFRELATAAGGDAAGLAARFADQGGIESWIGRWRARLAEEPEGEPGARQRAMLGANPLYIARNHLVEETLAAAERDGDAGPLERLLAVLARPFDEQPGAERYALPPEPHEVVRQTFCGT